MRIEGNAAANCDDDAGWELITDPDTVDIASFNISNSESYTETISAGGDVQIVEKIRLSINGRMASADGPIKTFPLRGIKDSPPYLHDGRLLTLEDTVEFFNLIQGLQEAFSFNTETI